MCSEGAILINAYRGQHERTTSGAVRSTNRRPHETFRSTYLSELIISPHEIWNLAYRPVHIDTVGLA